MPKRRPLLPITTGISRPKFQIMTDAWRRLEKAYGHKIPNPVRVSIEEITVNFLWLAKMEQDAPPLSSVRKIISSAQRPAEVLLLNLKDVRDCKTDAHMFAGHLVRQKMAGKRLSRGVTTVRSDGKSFRRSVFRDDVDEVIHALGILM